MGLNVALAVLAPKIETKIDALPLPNQITSFLRLSDYAILLFDDYMLIGATPTIIAPPLPPAPAPPVHPG